jgi:histidinol phosphatase-like enzyme
MRWHVKMKKEGININSILLLLHHPNVNCWNDGA